MNLKSNEIWEKDIDKTICLVETDADSDEYINKCLTEAGKHRNGFYQFRNKIVTYFNSHQQGLSLTSLQRECLLKTRTLMESRLNYINHK